MPSTASPDYFILVIIILAAGILTGTTNYLINASSSEKPETGWSNYFKNVLLSTCAAIAVPLFLQAIPNSLLDNKDFTEKNYFLFAGFCVLAGYYAKRFLEDLYSKVNKADKKADAAQLRVKELEEQKTEVDQPAAGAEIAARKIGAAARGAAPAFTEDDAGKVLKAIRHSGYFFRTVQGIAGDSGLDEQKVQEILHNLEQAGEVAKGSNREGKEVWRVVTQP